MIRSLFAVLALALMVAAPSARAQDSDSLTWARANSCERIRDYIARYPSGRYLTQARQQLTARNCPAPQASAPADPCVQARADWDRIAGSTSVNVLTAYRNALPPACAVQRALANDRIAELQRVAPRPPQQQASATPPRATPPAQQATQPRPPPPSQPTTQERAVARTGQSFRDCDGCPEMVVIPAGSFLLGSPESEAGRSSHEGPQRRVAVSRFAAGKYEVTRGEFAAFVSATSRPTPARSDTSLCSWNATDIGGLSHPAVCVSWDDAQDYARWLSNRTGARYRLLSEAEWEYAARGGTTTAFWWGAASNHDYANYGQDVPEGQCCERLAQGRDVWLNASEVGQFSPNAFGLYDTIGNVWEWVEDCYAERYGVAPVSPCARRVLRGGSFIDGSRLVRSAYRLAQEPEYRLAARGFRVARDF